MSTVQSETLQSEDQCVDSRKSCLLKNHEDFNQSACFEPETSFLKTISKNTYQSPFSFVLENRVHLQEVFNTFFNTINHIYEVTVMNEAHDQDEHEIMILKQQLKVNREHLEPILSGFLELVQKFNNRQRNSINDFTFRHFSQDDLKIRRISSSFFQNPLHNSQKKVTFEDKPFNLQKARKILKYLWEEIFAFFQSNDQQQKLIDPEEIQEISDFIEIIQQNIKELEELFQQEDIQLLQQNLATYNMFSQQFADKRGSKPIFSQQYLKPGEFYFNSMKQENKPLVLQSSRILKFNVKLREINFPEIQPSLHQAYIAQAAQQVKRVVPVKIFNFYSDLKKNKVDVPIDNYFNADCPNKIMYYFEPGTKIMWAYDLLSCSQLLTQNKEQAMKIELNIKFNFSKNYRSVITPSGQLFLFSGKQLDKEDKKIDNSVMEFDFNENTFIERKKPMPVAKKNYAAKFMDNKIYIIGGETQVSSFSSTCEVFDLETRRWDVIDNLNEGVSDPTVVPINNKFLFKFGGINQFGFTDKSIERYNSFKNQWDVVSYSSQNPDEEINILMQCMGIQTDVDNILIFGGRNTNDFKQDTGYLFEDLGENEQLVVHKLRGEVKTLENAPQTIYSYAGVWNQENTVVHNNSIYFLRKDYF